MTSHSIVKRRGKGKAAQWLAHLFVIFRANMKCNSFLQLLSISSDTEIDWRAYIDQVKTIEAGERNYLAIRGGTGPLVYPAGHVVLYRLLLW